MAAISKFPRRSESALRAFHCLFPLLVGRSNPYYFSGLCSLNSPLIHFRSPFYRQKSCKIKRKRKIEGKNCNQRE
ncbi:hypothetical protein M752DRAFT_44633 [Aspergillus phoenicis ATCC 13157]|uniref:Uncharacterized protein n=1 Tax=Aspergillus phoenicis ATCC 13157 TaxID=1353007 RepID=A0A370PE88_ASPPH|nr:hypothetical protein M752DRAFT_44633 [Aspergillus phoenicis ATCC 13157]